MFSNEFKLIQIQMKYISKQLDINNQELKRLNDLLSNVKRIEVEKNVYIEKDDWEPLYKGPNDWS